MMVSTKNNKAIWASLKDKVILGFDKSSMKKLKPVSDIKSEHACILRGAQIYASRYENELKILKCTLPVEEIFSKNREQIKSKFTHSMKKGNFNFLKVENPASCLAISPDYKYIYSGWEDGKIRVLDLLKKKEEGEISAPAVQDEILLPDDKENLEMDNSGSSGSRKLDKLRVISHYDSLLPGIRTIKEDLSNSSQQEYNSDLLVTSLVVSSKYLIAGYSTGIIMFYDPADNFKLVQGYPIPDGSPDASTLEKISSLVLTKDNSSVIVTTASTVFKLSIEKEADSPYLKRADIYHFPSEDVLRTKQTLQKDLRISRDRSHEKKSNRREKNHKTEIGHGVHLHNHHTVVVENLMATRVGHKDLVVIDMENVQFKKHIWLDEKIQGHIVGLGITQELDKIIVACSRGEVEIFEIQSQVIVGRFNLKSHHGEELHVAEMKMTEEGMLIFGFLNGEIRCADIGTREGIQICKKMNSEHKPDRAR
jgi:hypothetical protein